MTPDAILGAPWFDRAGYPFTPRSAHVDGHRLSYLDEGRGDAVVLVHGTPSWNFEWRAQVHALSADHRVVAPDLLGFGLSDRPVDGDYTLAAHRRRLCAVLDAAAVDRFHLVVHDFGGPIALPLVVEMRDRVRSVTVVHSWCWGMELDPAFTRQKGMLAGSLVRWLYLRMNFSPRFLVKQAWGRRKPLTAALHRHFTGLFPSADTRRGAYGFVRALLDEGPALDAQWPAIRDAMSSLRVAVGWGMADRVVTPVHLQRWRAELPHAAVEAWEDVGHWPQEEAAEEVTALIRRVAR